MDYSRHGCRLCAGVDIFEGGAIYLQKDILKYAGCCW